MQVYAAKAFLYVQTHVVKAYLYVKMSRMKVCFYIRMRVSLVVSGYVRPPFCLILEKPSWFSRYRIDKNGLEPFFPNTNNVFLYLWPDRLGWGFLTVAIVIFVPLLIKGQGLMILIEFSLLLIVFPWFIFRICRIPLLGQVWGAWPKNEKKYLAMKSLEAIAVFDLTDTKTKKSTKIFRYFPVMCLSDNDAIFWSPSSSRQKAILHMAICDMFKRTPDETGVPDWQTRAFVRWLFYWAAPVWAGYATLLVLLLCAIFIDCLNNKSVFYSLYASGLCWGIFSIFFIWFESKKMSDWLSPNKQALRMDFPPPAINQFNFSPSLYLWFNEKIVQLILATVNIVVGSFYLEIIRLVTREI